MAKVSFPARCAVAVICGEHLVSQVYPASVPVEVFIDNVVELLNEELKRRGVTGLDPGVGYELNRANGTRLDVTKTLDELGVEDGSTLVLVPAQEGESFEPQYESLSTGLARVGKRLFAPVTAETAAHTAMAVLAMVSLAVLGLSIHTRLHTDSLIPAIVTGTVGLLLAVGAGSVWRWWPQRSDLLGTFAWLAVPLLAVAFAAAAPGRVGAAHLFIAGLATAVLTAGAVTMTQRHVTVAAVVMTLCAVGGLVAVARMWRPVPAQWLGMCTLVGLLLLLTLAPTFALWAARIRPPHFGSITGRDLFRRSDGLPVDTVSPVDEDAEDEPNPDTTPPGAVVTAAAKRANSVLTGICVAAAIALPAAVWATLMPGRAKSNAAAVLAGLFVLIFISRGRAFADKRQAVALVCGAAAALCVGVIRYVVDAPADSGTALLWGVLVLAAFAGAGLAAALLVPVTRFTPLVRMLAEWFELAAIVAAFPLAAWIGGLFTWVRMR
ncbi:type VII secretion integral membrane protein EccD [Mycolicibacterium sp. CH28]|uniref:type VII secretion integral membrane protein EccD n=1 Tax=Mycolicibacterium sp. CH28 TaxID=2512237 RepID=UPI001080735C|nr:type VII secretion integral membrane protein EccD [Mycolicibacterium sp. CH28]TGD84494.1 type VII secretion integral membrane protein EccD [Mycolicibacterium sp. CH28]